MTIYYASFKRPYLEQIVDFVLGSYSDVLTQVKIIVPNTITCSELQSIFLSRAPSEVSLLPNIIPFSSIASESDMSYKIPSESLEVIGYLEQKLLLIDIIKRYQGFDDKKFSLLQASYLSDQLIRLFDEISAGDVDIATLPDIIEIDSAAHWTATTNFLLYAYNLWQEAIRSSEKIDAVTQQKLIFDIESAECESITIIVGIISDTVYVKDFMKSLSGRKNGIVILPPFDPLKLADVNSPGSPWYQIKSIIDYVGVKLPDLQNIDIAAGGDLVPNIQYIKVENFFEEAELIASLAIDAATQESVAIVTNNRDLINLCEIALNKYGYELQNIHGKSLLSTKAAEFVLLLAEAVLLGDVKKFTALIKTPYLFSDVVCKFDLKILRRPAIDDIGELLAAVEESEEQEIKEWFGNLWKHLSPLYGFRNKKAQFADLVNMHVDVINALSDDFWGGEEGFAMSEFFREVMASANNLGMVESEYYPDLMRQLLEPAKFFPKIVSNIVAINPRDASLLDYDRVIIADCNEDSLPRARNVDPWMNDKMRVELGLASAHEAIGASHYSFLLLLNKKEVYLTRSTTSKSKHNIESRFISDLLLSMNEGDLSSRYDWNSFIKNKFTAPNRQEMPMSIGNASDFVHNISVTNIELLMRNPYGFYAKKILGLSSLDDITCAVSMADFGTLMHNIIALYTENYDPNIIDKYQYMLTFGKGVFDQFYSHKKSRIWWQKFITIAQSFVEWDEARREELVSVYSEIYGEMKLNILGHNIKVTAIADRIEVTKGGEVRILDYKTGTVPTKQDVMSGLSPQLMIEAMIVASGGFKGVPSIVPHKITYVKITNIKHQASSETSLDISEEGLEQHKKGMIKLLENYISSPVFLSDPNVKHAVRYNDYKHLARL